MAHDVFDQEKGTGTGVLLPSDESSTRCVWSVLRFIELQVMNQQEVSLCSIEHTEHFELSLSLQMIAELNVVRNFDF